MSTFRRQRALMGLAVALVGASLSACTEGSFLSPSKKEPSSMLKFNVNPIDGKLASASVARTTEADFEMLEKARAALDRKFPDRARGKNPNADTPPFYAVVPSLPDGVLFKVIRDPASPRPRMVVVSEQTVTDLILYRAVARLGLDEMQHLHDNRVRTVTMFRDNHDETEVDGKVVDRRTIRITWDAADPANSVKGDDTRNVLREITKQDAIDLGHGLHGRVFKPAKNR